MDSVIKIKDLSVIYDRGTPRETVALFGVNLEIYPGELTIIFGPSGCGKSTLLYCIAGLEQATGGSITVDGSDIASFGEREKALFRLRTVGMIFQAYYLIPYITVLNNIVLPQIFASTPRSERTGKAMAAAKYLGIDSFVSRLPMELSGGQQQRVAIARSLMNDPQILLADEPVGNLDSKSSDEVMAIVRDVVDNQKKTVILVTHDARYLSLAHRVVYMKDGRLERVVINKTLRTDKRDGFQTLLERFMLADPHASIDRIKSRILLKSLKTGFGFYVDERLEKFLEEFFSGKIDFERFKNFLDAPFRDGGCGLYSKTAESVAQKIEWLLRESLRLKRAAKLVGGAAMFLREAEAVYVNLSGEHGLNFEGKKREIFLEKVFLRLRGEISREELLSFLDASEKNGGLGLDQRVALHVSDDVEVLNVDYSRE